MLTESIRNNANQFSTVVQNLIDSPYISDPLIKDLSIAHSDLVADLKNGDIRIILQKCVQLITLIESHKRELYRINAEVQLAPSQAFPNFMKSLPCFGTIGFFLAGNIFLYSGGIWILSLISSAIGISYAWKGAQSAYVKMKEQSAKDALSRSIVQIRELSCQIHSLKFQFDEEHRTQNLRPVRNTSG
ncbi:uncharacterized protein LOC110850088 [Folsomia candida]|uniref:uncharacterized protein LOC110850088 n=1 Tax=Folsomia candida TaxID=158441 RepID=UPI000B8F0D83|nr:uncharacterized protein LOC110850088 [Folsomia candida]